MKLMLGKPDDTAMRSQSRSTAPGNPIPTLASDMASFLAGADPEQFEMWVEEMEDA